MTRNQAEISRMSFARAGLTLKHGAGRFYRQINGGSLTLGWGQIRSALRSGGTAQKSVIALVDQGVVSVTNFLTGLIIGRTCTKDEFGLYMLGFTLIVFAIDLQGFLISTPYTIFSPRMKGQTLDRYTGSTLLHQFSLSLSIMIFLALGWVFSSSGLGPPGLLPVLKTLIFVISFILLRDYARRIYMAALKMKATLLVDTCVALLQIPGLLVLARFNLLSASRVYWVMGIVCAVVALGWLRSMSRDLTLSLRHALTDFQKNLSTGLWILASGVLWNVSTHAYPWLLAAFHGTASAGIWAACLGIVALCNPIFMGLQNIFGPKIAHAYSTGENTLLRRFSLQTALIFGLMMAPVCLTLFIFGEELVAAVYGGKYSGTGLIVATLACNLLVAALGFSPSRALLTIERAEVDFRINLLMVIGLFSLGIFLVKNYGPAGAASGLLICNSGSLVFRYIAFSRLVRAKP